MRQGIPAKDTLEIQQKIPLLSNENCPTECLTVARFVWTPHVSNDLREFRLNLFSLPKKVLSLFSCGRQHPLKVLAKWEEIACAFPNCKSLINTNKEKFQKKIFVETF
ncbi:hypothetical protein CEXT_191641 [Caerostris extrusa]|uniref:Uncharacterized protein n=1 Tax=Caerostris extrusa TaxID=172846 RepID=A0AAV4RAJ7_CAEEX|nr:hypothetical protein CEXT_191641 [Caerostris extrusa]